MSGTTTPKTPTDGPKPVQIPRRQVTEYKKDPPQSNEGKSPVQFQISSKCGLEDRAMRGGKCDLRLMVVKVKNTHFEWDELGGGGQLEYDEKDFKFFEYCPLHGPFDLPHTW